MDEFLEEYPINVGIIDYLGRIENGVGILINLVVDETTYELGYWYNREGHVRIVPDTNLLDKLGVEDIYEYDKINELVYLIHNSLKDPDAILDEFLKEE